MLLGLLVWRMLLALLLKALVLVVVMMVGVMAVPRTMHVRLCVHASAHCTPQWRERRLILCCINGPLLWRNS